MLDYLPFFLIILLIAAFINADSVMTVIYMIVGLFLTGLWWSKTSVKHIKITRRYDDHAYIYQASELIIGIENTSILPIIWLEVHESIPVNLRNVSVQKYVISLPPKGKAQLRYPLYPLKRGFYQMGPTSISAGDLLGIASAAEMSFLPGHLIVYPQIVSLDKLGFSSRSPFGLLKHKDPIYDDPSSIFGKRDYQAGDPLRRIDWKSTAVTGNLQVKMFEPSITLETVLILDLNAVSYDISKRMEATEISITAAASIANWCNWQKMRVGLLSTGRDPLNPNQPSIQPITAQRGNGHIMQILEALAKVEINHIDIPITSTITDAMAMSAWGSTLVIITGMYNTSLLEKILQAKRAGLNIVLLLIGHTPNHLTAEEEARQFGFQCYTILKSPDLDLLQGKNL